MAPPKRYTTKRRRVPPVAVAVAPPPPRAPAAPANGELADLLSRWLDLSELNRRAFAAMTEEVNASSHLVETSVSDLSERFQALADAATAQTGRVNNIISVAQHITVDGECLSLEDVTGFIESLLGRVINLMITLSKHAMTMVYTLDDVSRDVVEAEACMGRIDGINRQTRFLALNATIEAERAGQSQQGGAFRVIASEIKDLSKATDTIARAAGAQIASVAAGVRKSHEVLREIATIDLSEHIVAKDRLSRLVAGLVDQSRVFQSILGDTARTSADLTTLVSSLTTGIQFQDRTKQQLEQVTFTLGVLAEAAADMQAVTKRENPCLRWAGGTDSAWQQRILAGRTLSDNRARFLSRLLAGAGPGAPPPPPAANDGGSVDLF